MKQFGLIGAAGYIAERHMKAIKDTGNSLLWASDKFDVMGRIDSYFPEAEFFMDLNDSEGLKNELYFQKNHVEYISICSPNYFHSKHIEFSLKNSSNVICEKPLVINPEDLFHLEKLESETEKKIFTVLQLRYHPAILQLKKEVEKSGEKTFDIDLTYITSRGKWYSKSWKGDTEKSGGIATNIGIHFFDMLIWIFGKVKENTVHLYESDKAAGFLQLEKARIRWFLSIDSNDLPNNIKEKGMRTFRSINMDGKKIEFSGGFTDLHTVTYQNILNGNGFGIDDAKESITLSGNIRNSTPIGSKGDYHPFLKK